MKYEEIKVIAERYKNILAPYCKRIEIAGSIRRKKDNPRDIELVIIRDPEKIGELKEIVDSWYRVKGDISGRYTQRVLLDVDIKLDIFIAVDDGSNWGNIFLIRTGNWIFSRFMMGIRSKQVGYEHHGGYLWLDGDIRVDCFEEQDVFDVLKMKFIPPEERSWK